MTVPTPRERAYAARAELISAGFDSLDILFLAQVGRDVVRGLAEEIVGRPVAQAELDFDDEMLARGAEIMFLAFAAAYAPKFDSTVALGGGKVVFTIRRR